MPAGLQVYGSHGVFQIDGTFKNLALRAKYSVVTTAALGSVGVTANQSKTDIFSHTGITNPVVAVRCTTQGATLYWLSGSQFQIACNGAVGTAIDIYVFGDPIPSVGGKYLQVYNASGELVFDAGQKYMRVVGIATPNSLAYSQSFPAGRIYAAVVTAGYSRDYETAGPGIWYKYELRFGVSISGTTVMGNGIALSAETVMVSGTDVPFNTALVLTIDVTDY